MSVLLIIFFMSTQVITIMYLRDILGELRKRPRPAEEEERR